VALGILVGIAGIQNDSHLVRVVAATLLIACVAVFVWAMRRSLLTGFDSSVPEEFETSVKSLTHRLQRFGVAEIGREYSKSFGDAAATFEAPAMRLRLYRDRGLFEIDAAAPGTVGNEDWYPLRGILQCVAGFSDPDRSAAVEIPVLLDALEMHWFEVERVLHNWPEHKQMLDDCFARQFADFLAAVNGENRSQA
jgi:hypothetical protein